MYGICVKFDRVGRWGFITSEDVTLPDVFVHATEIVGTKAQRFLVVGQKVEFEPCDDGTDRPIAKNVRKFPFTIAIQRSTPAPVQGEPK